MRCDFEMVLEINIDVHQNPEHDVLVMSRLSVSPETACAHTSTCRPWARLTIHREGGPAANCMNRDPIAASVVRAFTFKLVGQDVCCSDNLAPLCPTHHVKQAHGWRLDQPEPGTLVWTAPHGSYMVTSDPYPA